MPTSSLIRNAFVLLLGHAATALLTLARNLLVARLLPVADYGVAATFAVTMAAVEMASALGLQQQIVQDRRGDDLRFQAALQGFQLARGLAAALLLVTIAHPVATFLGIPEVAWAYQVLAAVPVLNAIQHFDIHRLNRQMRYGPLLLAGTVPAFVSLLLVWPLAVLFSDWQVMLWAILTQAAVGALTSHVVAERPWRVTWVGAVVLDSVRFGWPLLLESLMLFFIFHGEKLIVGRAFGMEALGLFAMGVTLTLTPTLILARTTQNLFLPRLSAVDRTTALGQARFQTLAGAAVEAHFASGTVIVVGMLLFSGPFVTFVLGPKFADLMPLLVPMAAMQALRVFKGGPSTIALVMAQTENSAAANVVRVALLPVAWLVAEHTGRIDLVIALGLLGEAVGLAVALWLLRRRGGILLLPLALPLGASLLAIAGALLVPWAAPQVGDAAAVTGAVVLFAVSLLCLRHVRRRRP